MPTRRQANGATVARNVHPRLRLSAAPHRQNPYASLRQATDARRPQDPQDLRTAYQQFVRRLWFMAS